MELLAHEEPVPNSGYHPDTGYKFDPEDFE